MKYTEYKSKERIRWVKTWTNKWNGFRVMALNYVADPAKDPTREWAEWYENERKGMPKAKWEKEYEWEFESASSRMIFGKEYCDLDSNVHFIPSFDVEWELLFSLDFGQSNPSAWLIGCYTIDWTLYIIDEYYNPAIPSVSSREMFIQFHDHFWITEESARLMSIEQRREVIDDTFQIKVIDPTTRHKNRTSKRDWEEIPYSVIEEFSDNGWDFEPWVNDVDSGITKIRELFKLDSSWKSKFYIFQDKCPNLCDEIVNYRYKDQTDSQARTSNSPDTPIKKHDHWVDSLRYLVFSRPFLPSEQPKQLTRIQKDILNMNKPQNLEVMWSND